MARLTDGGKHLEDIRKFILRGSDTAPHAWTPDVRAVVFESNRDGAYRVFQQALNKPNEELLVEHEPGGQSGRFSPDGKWLFYKVYGRQGETKLMRMPASGGLPQVVFDNPSLLNCYCTSLPANFCLAGLAEQKRGGVSSIGSHAGATRGGFSESQLGEPARTHYNPMDWGISPDGSRLAMVRPDGREGRIHMLPLPAGIGWHRGIIGYARLRCDRERLDQPVYAELGARREGMVCYQFHGFQWIYRDCRLVRVCRFSQGTLRF